MNCQNKPIRWIQISLECNIKKLVIDKRIVDHCIFGEQSFFSIHMSIQFIYFNLFCLSILFLFILCPIAFFRLHIRTKANYAQDALFLFILNKQRYRQRYFI